MKKIDLVGTVSHNWNEHSGYFWEWGDIETENDGVKEHLSDKILNELPKGKKVRVLIEFLD